MSNLIKVTTIGDGAMATVCSQILAAKENVRVRVWGRNGERLAEFQRLRENVRYLPGVKLAERLAFEANDAAAFWDGHVDLVVCAVPTQFIRPVLTRLREHVPAGVPVVSVAKGIEIDTLRRPSEIIRELLGLTRAVAALSGPNIAGELARQLPATMVVASSDPIEALQTAADSLAHRVQELFSTPYLRVYRNDDLLGVEMAGALKNVVAIAAGILDGMRAGNNAKAALLSRGLVEITRLGVAMGAAADTFTGLAGLGDLVTTCVSPEGRNRSFGERVGRGEKPAEAAAAMAGVVEGMPTCRSVVALARAKKIEMPISEGLHGVLFEGQDVRSQLANLMTRELKNESQ